MARGTNSTITRTRKHSTSCLVLLFPTRTAPAAKGTIMGASTLLRRKGPLVRRALHHASHQLAMNPRVVNQHTKDPRLIC
ncbi:hypothetical protein IWX48DRAFT_615534 [Phyllosticta citricarpa]